MEDKRNPEGFEVATAYLRGEVVDYIANWETAIQLANEGYRVVVHTGDGHLSRREIQAMVDRERHLVADCFGPDYTPDREVQ